MAETGEAMRVFVAGGTGFVGGHLRRTLLADGHTVRLLVHRRSDGTEAGIEQVEGDALVPAGWADNLKGCDAVINLIGIIREFPGRGITFEKLHVGATRALVDAAKKAGIGRYLQMSALGTRPDTVSLYHQTKYRAEEYVRASGLAFTIFRPSLIFGPKDAFVNMLADQVRTMPAVPVVGDGHYRLQPIHADDVARCFAGSLAMPETIGKTYELCGTDCLTFDEMLDLIGWVMGKVRVVKIHNPLTLMKLAVPLLQRLPFFPLTMDQLTMLTEESICNGAWHHTFGFEPTRFEDGIRAYLKK
jgi:NADH dehydrogenase